MTYRNDPRTWPAFRPQRRSLLLFLFLATVFFFCQHDLFYSRTVSQGYDFSVDQVVAAMDAGSINRQIALGVLGVFAVGSLVRHRGLRLRINGPLGWLMVFYACLAFLSPVWADDTMLTVRRLMVFATLCLATAAIARRFSLRQVVWWTFMTTGIYLAVGVLAEIALGTFRPFTSGYRFAGTIHPNHQGINCVLFLLSGVAVADMEKTKKTIFRFCALIGIVFLVLTGSRTAFAAGFLALTVYFLMVSPKQAKLVALLAALLVGMALWVPFALSGGTSLPNVESAFMLGRHATKVHSFNGRSDIWNNVSYYIDRRPILGYGYGGFWTVRHITELTEATEKLGTDRFGVSESHDAYIDCLLDLGFVGLTAFVLILVGGVVRSVALYRASHSPALAFSGAFLVFCLVNGLLESAIVGSIFFTFLILMILIQLGFRRTVTEHRPSKSMARQEIAEVMS